MGGHTAASRLLALARKPAPVQVAYLLGHGYTSGLSAMDAFLADAALVPAGAEALFTETVVRLYYEMQPGFAMVLNKPEPT